MGVTTQDGHLQLEAVSDKEFRDLVDKELRKDHPHTAPGDRSMLQGVVAPKLRQPEVIHRWIMVLESMKASSETQLGAKRDELRKLHERIPHDEYLERLREFQGWRAGNVRFLNSVNSRLLEARELRRKFFGAEYPARIADERNMASSAYLRLLAAIERHHATVDAQYDATEADLDLWGVISTPEP